MHPFLQLIDSFSEDNALRGAQFERLCKWYLETHPLYSSKLTKVWLWSDWPGNWGRDCGIDLVAKDTEGKVWAIQAKCYSPGNSITKRDIDSFLSESTSDKIDYRFLMATTDAVAPNAVAVIKRQTQSIPIIQHLLDDFLTANIDWPKSISQLSTGKKKNTSSQSHIRKRPSRR